jgi:hypothetical protein
MISRLVTVDLVLTMSQRLRLLPELNECGCEALYEVCIKVLNGWAKRIETEGLNVSLDSIAENALSHFLLPTNTEWLPDIGDKLIDWASRIESSLCGERWIQPFAVQRLQDLENAVRTGKPIEWFEAAKRITELANSTDASNRLQEFFTWLLRDIDLDENSTLRQLLTIGGSGKKPDIPEPLILEVRKHLRVFKALRCIKSKK